MVSKKVKCFVCEALRTSLSDEIVMLDGVDLNADQGEWKSQTEYFHLRCITLVSLHPERFDEELCRRVKMVSKEAGYCQRQREEVTNSYLGFAKYYNLEKKKGEK